MVSRNRLPIVAMSLAFLGCRADVAASGAPEVVSVAEAAGERRVDAPTPPSDPVGSLVVRLVQETPDSEWTVERMLPGLTDCSERIGFTRQDIPPPPGTIDVDGRPGMLSLDSSAPPSDSGATPVHLRYRACVPLAASPGRVTFRAGADSLEIDLRERRCPALTVGLVRDADGRWISTAVGAAIVEPCRGVPEPALEGLSTRFPDHLFTRTPPVSGSPSPPSPERAWLQLPLDARGPLLVKQGEEVVLDWADVGAAGRLAACCSMPGEFVEGNGPNGSRWRAGLYLALWGDGDFRAAEVAALGLGKSLEACRDALPKADDVAGPAILDVRSADGLTLEPSAGTRLLGHGDPGSCLQAVIGQADSLAGALGPGGRARVRVYLGPARGHSVQTLSPP